MCRFLVYKGSEPILLSKLITNPSHSILNQSFDSRLRLDTRRPHNGDGFGVGYYTDIALGPEPCIFTSTIPAWNCINLERIASKTASSLIFAHVRATTEGSLSDDNCHPFSHGTLMWMHNGGLGGWKYIKRRLGEKLLDKWYDQVHGSTDSEWAFALFLNTLNAMGHDPSNPPTDGFGPAALRTALLKTIQQINELIREIPEQVVREENVDCRSLLNFAISDGHTVVCSRYVSSHKDEAASLYYSSGTSWDDKTDGNYRMGRKDKGADVVLVASEPLTFERDNWVTVPTNSTITIHRQTVMVHPILDEYYNPSPDFKRSSKLAISKGLDTNEKAPTPSPTATPGSVTPNPVANPNFSVGGLSDLSDWSSPNSRNEIIVSSPFDIRKAVRIGAGMTQTSPSGLAPNVAPHGPPSLSSAISDFPSPNSQNGILVSSPFPYNKIRREAAAKAQETSRVDGSVRGGSPYSQMVGSTDLGSPVLMRVSGRYSCVASNSHSDNPEIEYDSSEEYGSAHSEVLRLTHSGHHSITIPQSSPPSHEYPPSTSLDQTDNLFYRFSPYQSFSEGRTLLQADDHESVRFGDEVIDEAFVAENDTSFISEDNEDGGVLLAPFSSGA